MKFKIETEGGWVNPLPKTFEGSSSDLSQEHAEALKQLFDSPDEFKTSSSNPLATDLEKYSLELENDNKVQKFSFDDTHLKTLPSNISNAIIHLSNKAKFS